ncbi:MAG TPA: phosphatase PAP2 family protein [Pirellulales bacterium]|jgi:membrane-associated phospholipid phosphatase|nr:phosphatase PAP2 family protein [Pirellulales bacterium]
MIFAGLVIAAAAALAVDLPIAQWLAQDPSPLPKILLRVVVWSEVFAYAVGVGLFALAVYLLDPARRVALPRLLTMSWGAGLMADLAKLTIQRLRPREFDYDGGVLDTFGPLLNLGNGHGSQSFPSAHAASAVGLAVALSFLYPRGRGLFVALAALACLQRLTSSAHFLSDVLAGAAIGYLFAQWCLGRSWMGRHFDDWEAGWRRRASRSTHEFPATEP